MTSKTDSISRLVLDLADIGAVATGRFRLASGITSPIYIDLRLLVSAPSLLERVAAAYAALLAPLDCDRIAGVPYAGLPIGTALALQSGIPLIYVRKEAKEYGTGRTIEGRWKEGEHVVIIEDLITSGGSVLKSAQQLRQASLVVNHALMLIDREQGGVEALARAGIQAHCVVGLTHMLSILLDAERITHPQYDEIQRFLAAH